MWAHCSCVESRNLELPVTGVTAKKVLSYTMRSAQESGVICIHKCLEADELPSARLLEGDTKGADTDGHKDVFDANDEKPAPRKRQCTG